MKSCTRCGSYAINPGNHGRDKTSDLDQCDVCYWRFRVQSAYDDAVSCGLTLATLCDMVLGDDAGDRSDDALIRGVRRLIHGQRQKNLP